MFRTLRSRLLFSYLVVIFVMLLGVAVALGVFATLSTVRFLPVLQNLAVISQSNRRDLLQMNVTDLRNGALERLLNETAEDNHVRIFVTSAAANEIIYDSNSDNNWVGDTVDDIIRFEQLQFPLDSRSIVGRFHHTNGSAWLLYSQPTNLFDRINIFYARREPTPSAFFQQFFLRPLIGAGSIAAVIAFLLALWIARSVARPLQQMADATEAFAKGEFEQELPLHGPEEVRRVATSFNRMATQVQAGQQAQRDFVANVSHDLKTPITSVRGWSQALLDGMVATPEEKERAASVIYNEAERMDRMVTQLLDLARLESGEFQLTHQTVDLEQLVTGVHSSLLPRAQEKNIDLRLEAQPVPSVKGDPDRLIQVFANLVDNGLTHVSSGGWVKISARPFGMNEVEVTVQDNGSGIAEDELSRIFERFYQVDKSRSRGNGRSGSGLGLAIVRELIEAHNGHIQAQSQVGVGSAFIVHLPIEDK